tara:strand:+ start:1800 stop:2345 length:546 start_codon:yes stop_codon:yes gene_type:complete
VKTFDQIRDASTKSDNVLSENILSRLTGGHGRYIKRLKNAHDHHQHLRNGHSSLEDKIGRTDGSHEFTSDREETQSFNHYMAHEDHHAAADEIKKYAYHVKKHKLTSAPKKTDSEGRALHKKAQEASQQAHYASHTAIKSHTNVFVRRKPHDTDLKHVNHVKELSKALGKHGSNQHHPDLK